MREIKKLGVAVRRPETLQNKKDDPGHVWLYLVYSDGEYQAWSFLPHDEQKLYSFDSGYAFTNYYRSGGKTFHGKVIEDWIDYEELDEWKSRTNGAERSYPWVEFELNHTEVARATDNLKQNNNPGYAYGIPLQAGDQCHNCATWAIQTLARIFGLSDFEKSYRKQVFWNLSTFIAGLGDLKCSCIVEPRGL